MALLDELFHASQPVLTGVDAFSTYCFLLQAVAHRDEDTWGYYLLEAEEQGLNPDYTIADAGKGIRAGQQAAWGDTVLQLLGQANVDRVYLDGSFVSSKEYPNDFDGCYDDLSILLN